MSSLGDPDLKHRDGVAWYEAPVPRRWHRCWVQTSGWIGLTLYVRCACGAISEAAEEGVAPRWWDWMERNSR